MNCHLSNCTKTGRDGRVTTLAKCALPTDALGDHSHPHPPTPNTTPTPTHVHTGAPDPDPNPDLSSSQPFRVVLSLQLSALEAGRHSPPHHPCSCFLRGSHVRFMVLPDILKNAPFFKKIDTKASKARSGTGKAKAAAKERTVGARPISPRPIPQSRRSTPSSSCTWCVHAHPHTTGRRARCATLLAACVAASPTCGAWSQSHLVPPRRAQVGPHQASRLIERPGAAGATATAATLPSTKQTGSVMSQTQWNGFHPVHSSSCEGGSVKCFLQAVN